MKILPAIIFNLVFVFTAIAEPGRPLIKIGVPLPLTGEAATYGVDIKNVLEFVNAKLGKNRYQFLFEDDRCSGAAAATIVQKLVNVDHVAAVFGFGCSGAMLSAAPLLERAKIPTITMSASAAAISKAGDYIFRTFPSDAAATSVLADYVRAHFKKPGLISEQTEYSQGIADGLEEALSSLVREDFVSGTPDLRAQLLRMRQAGVDAVIMNPQAEPGAVRLYQQIRELGWEVPVLGIYFPGSPAFLNVVGKTADGIIFSNLPASGSILNAEGKKLFAEFKAHYPPMQTIDIFFITTYTGFVALDEALTSSRSRMKDFRSYLYQTHFKNIIDDYSFDKNGDIVGLKPIMMTIKNGKPEVLK